MTPIDLYYIYDLNSMKDPNLNSHWIGSKPIAAASWATSLFNRHQHYTLHHLLHNLHLKKD